MRSIRTGSWVAIVGRIPAWRASGVKQAGGQREETLVDVVLGGMREVGRFLVGSLDHPDAAAAGNQGLEIARGAEQIGLQAESDVSMARAQSLVDIQRALRVGAGFHVDRDRVAELTGALGDLYEVREGERLVEIQAELGELDRYLGVDRRLGNPFEDVQVVAGDRGRFVAVADVFAEVGEDRSHAAFLERRCRSERVVQGLARHEARDRAPDDARLGGLAAQPRVFGAGEQRVTDQVHEGKISGCPRRRQSATPQADPQGPRPGNMPPETGGSAGRKLRGAPPAGDNRASSSNRARARGGE